MNMKQAMEARKSVRSYLETKVPETVLQDLKANLECVDFGMATGKLRFEVIGDAASMEKSKTGFLFGVGKIKAPAMFVCIYENEQDRMELGMRMEQGVLSLTKEGYGSCILGTFSETEVGAFCHLTGNEKIANVVVFGTPAEKSFMNQGFRTLAGGTKRKPYQEILLNAEDFKETDPMVDVVKHAIMAPSGNNLQPVRVQIKDNTAKIYTKGDHLVDAGIFTMHFYLGCLDIYEEADVVSKLDTKESIDDLNLVSEISW